MYVPRAFSEQTAARIRGLRPWVTTSCSHDGLRVDGERVLGRLIDLARAPSDGPVASRSPQRAGDLWQIARMSVRLRDVLMRELGALRYEPIDKRIRGVLGDHDTIDSTRAMLVWEPRTRRTRRMRSRTMTSTAGLVRRARRRPTGHEEGIGVPAMGAPHLGRHDRSSTRACRSPCARPTDEALTIRTPAGGEAAAFRPADDALAGYVIVDFDAFDAWYEEDEGTSGTLATPFTASTSCTRGATSASSTRCAPRRVQAIRTALRAGAAGALLPAARGRAQGAPGGERHATFCAYKGEASYLSVGAGADLAWSYPQPLPEARRWPA